MAEQDPGFEPIQDEWRAVMNAIMAALDDVFQGAGICLFVFDQDADGPRANYISNASRKQTLAAVKQWVARQESSIQ
jgi:hypothetical protein